MAAGYVSDDSRSADEVSQPGQTFVYKGDILPTFASFCYCSLLLSKCINESHLLSFLLNCGSVWLACQWFVGLAVIDCSESCLTDTLQQPSSSIPNPIPWFMLEHERPSVTMCPSLRRMTRSSSFLMKTVQRLWHVCSTDSACWVA